MKREAKCLWMLTVRGQVSAGAGETVEFGSPKLDIGWEIAFSDQIDHLIGCLTRHVAPGRY